MTTLTIAELRELAPGFVMGTLTLEERRSFDASMTSPIIAAELEPEVAGLRAAMDYLATSYVATPPASLRDRVVARIASEKAADAHLEGPHANEPAAIDATAAARALTPRTAPSLARTVNVPAIVLDERNHAAGRPRNVGWWTAGALLVALAASLLVLIDVRGEALSLRTSLAEGLTALTLTKGQLAQREKLLATVLGNGSDVTLVKLQPNQPQGPGMQVFWNVRQGRAIVTASGLAPIAKNRAYALWMIRDSKPVAIALFTPDASGRAVIEDIALPSDATGIAAFAVTEEPAGGSPQPTMTPFLLGTVPKS